VDLTFVLRTRGNTRTNVKSTARAARARGPERLIRPTRWRALRASTGIIVRELSACWDP